MDFQSIVEFESTYEFVFKKEQERVTCITALLIVEDKEAQPQQSVYGKTELMQLVGITESALYGYIR